MKRGPKVKIARALGIPLTPKAAVRWTIPARLHGLICTALRPMWCAPPTLKKRISMASAILQDKTPTPKKPRRPIRENRGADDLETWAVNRF